MKPTELAWRELLAAPERRGLPAEAEIRRQLVHAIEDGRLQPHSRLPSSRRLAALLGVARVTVLEVYQRLVEEGYLTARERSGVFVAPLNRPEAGPEGLAAATDPARPFWSGRFAVRPAEFLNIAKPRDWQRYPYPFLFGQLDPALFPTGPWREAVKATSSVAAIQSWSADMIDEDDPALVEQLCRQVLPRRAVWARPAEVMITLGAQQALYLVTRLLLGPGIVAGVEDPGYPDLRHMARMQAGALRLLSVDAEGAVPDAAMAACQVALLTPGHQCPTSTVMPSTRRRDILRLARQRDMLLVEDDYDADLFAEGEAVPPLKSLDTEGRVIYVGSLSKVLAPGLRLGFVVAPPPVIEQLRALRRLIHRHPPSNNQRAMAGFIALGHYRGHLRRLGEALAERAALMDSLLPRHLPGCRWRCGAGASSAWVEGPPGLDSRALAGALAARGVLIEPGDVFFDDPAMGRSCFRLGWTAIRTDKIHGGLAILADAITLHSSSS
ncbi:PLP-dependent aminotransferase family protein [Roseomonas sp. KE0001]|uniref:aminotransferase-like domain-containing protein n=1 Tax=Roseomonas sp. KE0001 TaxID=2479201 RepID=UPI0018E02B57|nr:PLP-dependent aminotransferase family protein [Roseomonas sp. KE0001]MBI0433391.1 PLP-dependent aminotransferase family protein [Roseomonas sp. KE0001]